VPIGRSTPGTHGHSRAALYSLARLGTGRPGPDRGTAQVISELPDLDLTVRALAAVGPSWPAIQNVGYDKFAEAMRQALRPLHVDGIGVRIVSELGWVIGKVPAT